MNITYKAKEQGKLDPRIEKIFAPLKDLKHLQVFLHGSWADDTATAFSDIDDFVIIDDTILTPNELGSVEEMLLKVQDEFYRIDPLQHHGHWRIFKSQLEDYNNAIIPLFILEDSICLVGSNIIGAKINHNQSYYTLINSIKGFCVWIDKLFKKYFDGNINVYDLKRLVGSVVLLVPLINQLNGKNIDKKSSIINANQLFTKEAMPLIQWASDLRTNWNLLTKQEQFIAFASFQENIPLRVWQKHAELNAPVIDSKSLSEVLPTPELINSFTTQCVKHLDAATLIKKTISDYQKAYSLVEAFAIKENALMIGQFGEIKYPGISDLDVFICLPDRDYRKGQEDIRLFIEHNADLKYVFTHPPICVSESMLPHLYYVHTINNLKLTYNNKDLSLKTTLTSTYQDTLNILWSIFLLPGLEHEVPVVKHIALRDLLLRLKNAHTSIVNLHAMDGIKNNCLLVSQKLRNEAFVSYNETRINVEKEIIEAYYQLKNFNCRNAYKYCIIGRKLVLKEGTYEVIYHNKLTIISLPPKLYKTLKGYFYGNNKEVNQYLKSFNAIENICSDLNANVPAVFLLRQYKGITRPSSIKKIVFNLLSQLPFEVTKRILK